MRLVKIIFPFFVFVLALTNSPQRAEATTDVITISFSNTLTPNSISGAITPALSNRLINVNVTPGSSSISDMVGATSTSAVNWNAREILNTTGSNLLEGYLGTNTLSNGGNNVWFTGLTPNSKYTIYIYSQSPKNGDQTLIKYSSKSSPSSSYTTQTAGILTTNTSTTGYVNNLNYLVITTYSSSGGGITVNYSALAVGQEAVVNAVQIKSGDPASAPTPEPSSVVLMGVGGIIAGIFWIKRDRRLPHRMEYSNHGQSLLRLLFSVCCRSGWRNDELAIAS